jgi:DNA-binding beta-propeller fold protein YncE
MAGATVLRRRSGTRGHLRTNGRRLLGMLLLLAACAHASPSSTSAARPPLVLVADVPLPGKPVRFDYQQIDSSKKRLFIAHMNDASVVVVSTVDGSLVKVLPGIPTPRGVAVAPEAKRVFVTASPSKLVIIDSESLSELGRVTTGRAPDGVAWDATHRVVGVSDQGEGALSLLADSGAGARKQVALGSETGNVVFDAARAVFWVTVVSAAAVDRLVSVDPLAAKVVATIPLPGCTGAHGLSIHPNGRSALIACEGNSRVVRVELSGTQALTFAASGAEPDVLAIDAGLSLLYVAAESGDLRLFDLSKPGLALIGQQHLGRGAHSVAVDGVSHHVFFPISLGPGAAPILRIMRPAVH